jgi:hypothetical protein
VTPALALTPLRASIEGDWLAPSDAANRRWNGRIEASGRFAALLLAETAGRTWWAKSELAGPGAVPLLLDVHLLRWDALDFQLIFFCASGWIQDLRVRASSREFLPTCQRPAAIEPGQPFTLFATETEPAAALRLLLLAREDLRGGRSGVWRPRKGLERLLAEALRPALLGPRTGAW